MKTKLYIQGSPKDVVLFRTFWFLSQPDWYVKPDQKVYTTTGQE